MKLTEKQITVLTFLNLRKPKENRDGPLSGPEIGEWAFREARKKQGVREWARPALVALEGKGLVQRLGKSFDNADCWTITPAGRSALEASQ